MDNPTKAALWDRIRYFPFDDPVSSLPFSKKLQQENNWATSFTTAAIEEYRKFTFLYCILPKGTSPSPTVDKMGHLHLTYYQLLGSFDRNQIENGSDS